MESGRMTTQRCPSFSSLAIFTAAAMAVPELPPKDSRFEIMKGSRRFKLNGFIQNVLLTCKNTEAPIVWKQFNAYCTTKQAFISHKHTSHSEWLFIIGLVPLVHHLYKEKHTSTGLGIATLCNLRYNPIKLSFPWTHTIIMVDVSTI